jgi:hypothetical protein
VKCGEKESSVGKLGACGVPLGSVHLHFYLFLIFMTFQGLLSTAGLCG